MAGFGTHCCSVELQIVPGPQYTLGSVWHIVSDKSENRKPKIKEHRNVFERAEFILVGVWMMLLLPSNIRITKPPTNTSIDGVNTAKFETQKTSTLVNTRATKTPAILRCTGVRDICWRSGRDSNSRPHA